MAKITSKSQLVFGTNYFYHLVDFQGSDISIDATGGFINSVSTNFTSSSSSTGLIKRAIAVGDVITLKNTNPANTNEGVELSVDSVSANQIAYTIVSGSPSNEAAGADINIQAFKKTYEFVEAGGLSFIDGVSAIAWASRVVDDWDAQDLDIYDKVYTSIEPRAKSLASLNGWEPHNIDTLKAHRDMALEIRDTATSAARRVYACARSGDLADTTDQFTFWPATDAELDAPTLAVTTGFINEPILLVDTDNAIDNRGIWTFRCLEAGKTHIQDEIDIQFAEIVTVGSRNGIDPKLADPGTGLQLVPDSAVSAGGIYANIDLNVDSDESYDGDVDGTLYQFNGFVQGDQRTNEAVHTKLHFLLRQPTNINSDGSGPAIRGDKAPPISSFSGDLMTLDDFYLLGFNGAQRNSLQVADSTGITRRWPTTFSIDVPAPTIAIGGTFSVIHEDTFGSSNPTYLQDELGNPAQDLPITALTSIIIAFSTYNVGGHTPGTPLPLRLTWNRPGFIEPDNSAFIMTASNQTQPIQPTADPSYSAA